jgi:hypothetical protein
MDAPQTVPSNDWWANSAGKVLDAVIDYQRSRGVVTPAGYVGTNVNTGNIPIGQAGMNIQAAATPGGSVTLPGGGVLSSPVVLVGLVVAAVILAVAALKARR